MNFEQEGSRRRDQRWNIATRSTMWAAVLIGALSWSGVASAQVTSVTVGGTGGTGTGFRMTVPTDYYFQVLGSLYDGDYVYALQEFQGCLRGAVKNGTNYWIDSICYHTMCGESYYQMGQYGPALDHYNKALQLYVAFNDWLIPVRFSPAITQSMQAIKPIPWGQSQRQMFVGTFPDTVLIRQGQVDNSRVIATGGVVQQAMDYPLNPQEIVRCTCLAIRRRRDLLGPTAPHDALNNQVITVLSKRPVQPNHWTEAWVDVELGCAFSAAGKDVQAKPILEKAIIAAGQFDHPMTCIALLELGRIALNAGEYDKATSFFAEASYSANIFYDPIIVEEALNYAAITHFLANRPGAFLPVVPAAEWARREELRQLQARLIALAAENQCMLDQPQAAAVLIDNARAVTNRTNIMQGRLGAQLNYVSGLAQYQLGNVQGGDAAVNAALAFAQTGSLKMFHLALAEQMTTSRLLTGRMAKDIFAALLQDPLPRDWLYDPLETVTPLVYHHPLYFERWFELSLESKELDGRRALEIADLAKRHKFLSTQELGGRLLNLRWILEAPEAALPQSVVLQRQTLLTQFPGYEKLSQQARDLRAQLAALPLTTTDSVALKAQGAKFNELENICRTQEVMLKAIALRRVPADLVFPPMRTVEEVQKSLGAGQILLTFYVGTRNTFGFLMSSDKFGYWPIPQAGEVVKKLTAVLQGLGNFNDKKRLTSADLANVAWKQPARDLFELLVKESKADLPYGYDELVIVPDGMLWYVPFEALPASPQGAPAKPLIDLVRIRYAPTLGLAVGDKLPRLEKGKALVTVGKMFPTDDETVAAAAFAEFSRAVPLSEEIHLKTPLPATPATFVSLADRFTAFTDITPPQTGYFGWNPLTGDRAALPGSTLSDWLRLPWHGPEHVALPGFHTNAEDSLKNVKPDEAGYELFLSTTSLMAGGARTVLISRWRTGGRTSFDLVREFMQELPYTSASKAWQRSVKLAQQSPITPELEPRIHLEADAPPPEPTHPFFWAGYLVVDTGTEPPPPPESTKDVLNVVPKKP